MGGVWDMEMPGYIKSFSGCLGNLGDNSGPLSDCKEIGTPKQGMISDNKMVETV